ncbi:MAG: hypothetical protein AB7L09_22275 [Nitrospira sp.]
MTHALYHGRDNLAEAERIVEDTARQVRELPSRNELKRVERKSDRNRTVTLSLALILAVTAVLLSILTAWQQGKQAAATAINSSAIDSLKGPAGPQGPPIQSWTFDPGTGQQTCTRDPGSPDDAPTYSCAPTPPPGG